VLPLYVALTDSVLAQTTVTYNATVDVRHGHRSMQPPKSTIELFGRQRASHVTIRSADGTPSFTSRRPPGLTCAGA